jgi:hypothetical protein
LEGEIRNLESGPELLKGYQEGHQHRVAIVREQKSKPARGARRPRARPYIRGGGYFGEKVTGIKRRYSSRVLRRPKLLYSVRL